MSHVLWMFLHRVVSDRKRDSLQDGFLEKAPKGINHGHSTKHRIYSTDIMTETQGKREAETEKKKITLSKNG